MELIRLLAAFAEVPTPEHTRLARLLEMDTLPEAEKFSRLFLFQLPPYASIYLGEEGMLGGEARDRIAGFWRSIAGEPPPEPDHLPTLLSLYAGLRERQASIDDSDSERYGHARTVCFWEHLATWLPVYLDTARRIGEPPYDRWASLLLELLADEAAELGAPPVAPPALALAPALPDPRAEGGESFLAALTTPIRCGFLLPRSAIATLAEDLELGARQGERRFVLRALLAQSAPAVLAKLVTEADRAAAAHANLPAALEPTSAFWKARCREAATLLSELASAAEVSTESAGF